MKGHEVPSLGMFLREVHKEGNRAQATFYLYLAIPYLLQLVSGLSSIDLHRHLGLHLTALELQSLVLGILEDWQRE